VRTADPVTGIDLQQRLDTQVPLDVPFKDETGADVVFGQYFGKRPVILNLIFYKCPGICITEMDGMVASFKRLNKAIGKDFEVVTVSIDPRENPKHAAAKKDELIKQLGKPGAEGGWHFLTGTDENIRKVADAVGFKYVFDKRRGLYNHPAGLIILTPEGRTSRYMYGTTYTSTNVKFALMDASKGRIGSFVEKVLRSCYEYDPTKGKYGLVIMRVIQLSGITTILVLGAFLFLMFRWEKRRGYHLATSPGAGKVEG
jgi:protein SCO1/2